MICEQDFPLASFAFEATYNSFATCFDRHTAAGSAEGIGTGVNRVGQDMVDSVVDRQFPHNAAAVFHRVVHRRQSDPLPTEPGMHLANALELSEFREDQGHCGAYTLIRVLFDSIISHLHIANGYRQEQFAAPCFLLE